MVGVLGAESYRRWLEEAGSRPEGMDLAVTGGLCLTMRGDRLGILEDGVVTVVDGRIDHVGPADSVDAGAADRHIDAGDGVVIPGLVDAHAHTRHTLLRGVAQDVPEIEWMNRALGPFDAHVEPADREAGARLGVLEALRAGTTTVCEYADRVGDLVAAVHRPLGVRTVAVETISAAPPDRTDQDPDEPYPLAPDRGLAALERADRLGERFADAPLVEPAYGPQALDMVPLDLLERVLERARATDRRVHMHVAQGDREARQVQARFGADASTVGVLRDRGLTGPELVAAHLHGASAAERRALASDGVAMVGCPGSIAAIDGVAPPLASYADAGGVVAVGTDQAPGTGGHDLLRDLRTAALLSKTREGDPTAFPAWQALRAATRGGAAALGLADQVGRLAAGHRADIVVLEADALGVAPTVTEPLHTAVPNLVYGAASGAVRDVVVDGTVRVRDGAVVDADPAAAVADARERAARVARDATADWRAAGSTLVDRADEGWL